jgi:phosphoketolase
MNQPLPTELLRRMDAYWRAANYLSVGQIYLQENPLLRSPLTPQHIKPRLLGHWGTTPGQNFIYVHLNRVIQQYDLDMIYISGPGHGGPALVANTYLEGTYSELYPNVSQDEAGLQRLFKQFSFPGGIPSHVAPETPGSIHEGGELGYSLAHAYGAAFDNPNLIVACIVGDGEAETGPLATGWHSNKFLNPASDGAVLPILHLNGYKIANPTLLARIDTPELEDYLRGCGYQPLIVAGDDPQEMHQLMAATLDRALAEIRGIQSEARTAGFKCRPRWPAIVLKTPKGWTGPKVVDGVPVEGTFRAHQVPLAEVRTNPAHLRLLEEWLRSYRAEELFDESGRLRPELADLAPKGTRRMGANPQANGGALLRDRGAEPDLVMACAGDVPTLETLAAVKLLIGYFPALKIRVINVVDLMKLQPPSEHPHGLPDADFDALFTRDKPIIFAFHGYPWLIHRLAYRRANHHNLHARGYKEEGTITTPFDMAVLNDLDRFHLVGDAIDRLPQLAAQAGYVKQALRDKLIDHREYICKHGDDMPEICNWRWTP